MEAVRANAVCEVCHREMVPGGGCIPHSYAAEGEEPIPARRHMDAEPCHDCNAGQGRFHHPGCDWERCPTCGLQALGCEHTAECWAAVPS